MSIFRVLEALGQLSYHARVQLYRYYLLGPLQEQLGEVAGPWSNFQDDIGGPNG